MTRAFWTVALAAGLLWPGHVLSAFDGVPLNGRSEALIVGLAIPFLWVVHRRFLDRRLVRAAIVVLIATRVGGSFLTQQGLCARFSTAAPYTTTVLTIPIEEPDGILRSWDLRPDWHADVPACTAIVDRPYTTSSAFPAWFVNFTDFASGGRRNLTMEVSGYARVAERGRLSIDLDRDMTAAGRIGSANVSSERGEPLSAELDPGVHRIELRGKLTGDRWRFVPTWNGRDAFTAAALTAGEPRAVDRALGPVLGRAASLLVLVLAAAWTASLVLEYRSSPLLIAWCIAAACVLGASGAAGRFDRLSALLLPAAALVPVARAHRNLRGALLMVGIPWLALFAVRAIPQIGHFSAYSSDDWLVYQVSGYRIFLNGFWLEGGSRAFDFQPLYRWISGTLHLLFGDSSVGEVYWDAACLLAGAMVAFTLVEASAGYRSAVVAAGATLATFTLGTIWYFPGRGLSEIAAAGFAFLAALSILRTTGGLVAAAGAGALAVLTFYTRLNHLPFALSLAALYLPAGVPANWRGAWPALVRLNPWRPLVFAATLAAGVTLFALRTWWFTGVFSVLYGTALKNNDTGLRLTTIGSPEVWRRISHSLAGLVWMNEPPGFDPRSAIVFVGLLLSVLALLQVPRVSRLPLSIAAVAVGASASSFLAHTHAYPGRMSIHLVPFAAAMTIVAAASVLRHGRLPAAVA